MRVGAFASIGVVIAAAAFSGVYRARDAEDLHRRLQEARLAAELSCGRPIFLATGPPSADSLARFGWTELLSAAATGAPSERWQAIEILGEIGDRRAVPALLRALADRRGTVRPCLAAQSLGRLQDPQAIDALIEAARQRRNEDLRVCAIRSLGLLRARRAVPVLADAVRRGESLATAADALARIGTLEGMEAVAAGAQNPAFAPWLVEPLGEFGLREAEPELRRLSGSHAVGSGTQRAAKEGLWKLAVLSSEDREAALRRALVLERSSARRAWAAWRLGDEDLQSSASALATALGDSDEEVRLAAAAALLRFGAVSEDSLLAEVFAPGETGRLAVAALGLVGTERGLERLSGMDFQDTRAELVRKSVRWIRLRGFARATLRPATDRP